MKSFRKSVLLLCCTTSIFLFAKSSAKGEDAGSLLEEALRCERIVFESSSPLEAGLALEKKARLYASCEMYSQACGTLERIRLFALPPSQRSVVLMEKTLFQTMALNLTAAQANMVQAAESLRGISEGGIFDSDLLSAFKKVAEELAESTPQKKTYKKAFVRSFFPPLAHIYVGKSREGWLRALGDLGSIGIGVFEAVTGNYLTAFLAGGIGLYECFWKGNASLEQDVTGCNERDEKALALEIRASVLPDIENWLNNSWDI